MFGIEGWRCAFYLMALVSVVVSILTVWLAVDPRKRLAVSPSLLSWPRNRSHAQQRDFAPHSGQWNSIWDGGLALCLVALAPIAVSALIV